MKLPLKGKHIVLTRSSSAGDDWEKYLRGRGAIIHSFPMIETFPVARTPKLRRTLTRLGDFGWVIFTSAAGPRSFKELIKKMSVAIPANLMPPIAAIGERSAEAVRKIGYRVTFTASKADSATLARELRPLRSPILLLRADIASPELPRALRTRGARVLDIPIYRTKLVRKPDPRFSKLLKDGKIDYIVFASPSAVRGFTAQIKGDAMKAARNVTAIALGQRIRRALSRAGFRTIHVAPESNLQGIIRLFRG